MSWPRRSLESISSSPRATRPLTAICSADCASRTSSPTPRQHQLAIEHCHQQYLSDTKTRTATAASAARASRAQSAWRRPKADRFEWASGLCAPSARRHVASRRPARSPEVCRRELLSTRLQHDSDYGSTPTRSSRYCARGGMGEHPRPRPVQRRIRLADRQHGKTCALHRQKRPRSLKIWGASVCDLVPMGGGVRRRGAPTIHECRAPHPQPGLQVPQPTPYGRNLAVLPST